MPVLSGCHSLVVSLSREIYLSGPCVWIGNVSKSVSVFGRCVCLELSVILAGPGVIYVFVSFILYFIVVGGRWLKEGRFLIETECQDVG